MLLKDLLVVGKALDCEQSQQRKIELDRIAAMLSRLGGRGYGVKQNCPPYRPGQFDCDFDETKSNKRIHRTLIFRAGDPSRWIRITEYCSVRIANGHTGKPAILRGSVH